MEGVGRSGITHKGEAADSGRARGSSAGPGREVTTQAVGSGSEIEWD